MEELPETILASRRCLAACRSGQRPGWSGRKLEAEGGCGVLGVASSIPIRGKYLIGPCSQMRNRGNGKGGGIAAAGCFPAYPTHYALQIGYLDATSLPEVEKKYVVPHFDIAHAEEQDAADDYRPFGLEVAPPRVVRYFVRVKPAVLERFAEEHGFRDPGAAEDEFVFQNSFLLSREFYGDRADKQAFVLSHGRNMMILKAVGYAEDIARYYRLEETEAYVWIGHQRYPTRGRVWHPGGAHPFSGMDEALVHNGDFANYCGVVDYLKQRNYFPLYMTDTEVSVYLFDLYRRVYGYPMEYVIEALAPTTERDFTRLPSEKQEVYRAIQRAHLHGSPDGPWFFIIARSDVRAGTLQLIGITDTSMLRPQVFALQEGAVSVGVIASEKQAIDAFLAGLSGDDPRVCPVADRYWNARGGSYSDGGAFIFTVGPCDWSQDALRHAPNALFECADKFGRPVAVPKDQAHSDWGCGEPLPRASGGLGVPEPGFMSDIASACLKGDSGESLFRAVLLGDGRPGLAQWGLADLERFVAGMVYLASHDLGARHRVIRLLTLLLDRRYDTGRKRRSAVVARLRAALDEIFRSIQRVDAGGAGDRLVSWESRHAFVAPPASGSETDGRGESTLFIDCAEFQPQGDGSVASLLVRASESGWKRFVVFGCRGDRFLGCGLGPGSEGIRIDVYGNSGDYLGSGLDGAEVHVHGDAQDQVGQIMKSGKLVIHGMVGQTFLYGAKGGVAYVLGNAAGRPLINAVGRIRAIINGTALDYAAESFMAGATTGGGFLIINGIAFDERGRLVSLPDRYPGGNFFSLASGGAGYVNDPDLTLSYDQLNGGAIVEFTAADWAVTEPYLRENEEHFGIAVADLLDGREPWQVFRKVVPESDSAIRTADAHA